MPLQTFNLDCVSIEEIFNHAEVWRARSTQYIKIDNGMVYDSYRRARANGLRFNRKTNVMRDNRLGILSRPTNPSEWDEATPEEAREQLCHEIWCDAVRAYNVATMA